MVYKFIIDYLAIQSDSKDGDMCELNVLYDVLQKQYPKRLELNTQLKILIEKLQNEISELQSYPNAGLVFGTSIDNYSFVFGGKRHERKTSMVLDFWRLSVSFFEEIINQPPQPKLVLDFKQLPPFLTSEQVGELMGWKKSTIASKHSKGELASVEGTSLTPKQGLKDYIEKRTKGLVENPDKWFEENVRNKKNK